ncbi:MCE family protein [Nocardia sp. NPDC005978]|uniref:MCE family protein n=1 Tax=Nocardia sp. NPDC005978 TaxID=3156725 RepID=UPI0033B2BB65
MRQRMARLVDPFDRALTRFGLPPVSRMWAAIPSFRQNRHWWLGVGVAATILALLVGSGVLSRLHLGQDTVYAEFAQAGGLRTGDSVDMSGIQVGTVKSARIERGHILVGMALDRSVELGADARAAIKISTILGKVHIALEPGTGNELPGNRIRLDRTSVPYNLSKVVDDPTYKNSFEHLERVDPKLLRQSLDAVTRQLGDSPELTAQALDSVGALAKVISDRRDEVDSLLKNMSQVSQLVSDNQNSVLLLLTRGEAVGEAVTRRQDLLRVLLDNIAAVSKALRDMGAENGGQLGPLIQNLNTMSEGLVKNRENLDRLYRTMPVTLRQFNNAFGNGPYGDIYLPWLMFPDNWLCLPGVVEDCR